MTQILFVGMGGFLGSIARYLLVGLVQSPATGSFPFGTLAVNVAGCVVIGGLSELLDARPFLTGDGRAFLVIGLLGGFTTFSAFSLETMLMIDRGHAMTALGYALASVAGAIGALGLGLTLMRNVAA